MGRLPRRDALRCQPRIEGGKAVEAHLRGLVPDPPARVLHAFSTRPFPQPEATLQKSGSKR